MAKRGIVCICTVLTLLFSFSVLAQTYLLPEDARICEIDDDCAFSVPSKLLECSFCDPYDCQFYNVESDDVIAINKNWSPDCPQDPIPNRVCAACSGGIIVDFNLYKAKCINNMCTKTMGKDIISDKGVKYASEILEAFNKTSEIAIITKLYTPNMTKVDEVLATLTEQEFKLERKSPSGRSFNGNITKKGFDILINNSDVKSIYLVEILHVALDINDVILSENISSPENILPTEKEPEAEVIKEEEKSGFQKIIGWIKSFFGFGE